MHKKGRLKAPQNKRRTQKRPKTNTNKTEPEETRQKKEIKGKEKEQ